MFRLFKYHYFKGRFNEIALNFQDQFFQNKSFPTFNQLMTSIKTYEEENSVELVRVSSSKLKTEKSEACVYKRIVFGCVHGTKRACVAKKRKTR